MSGIDIGPRVGVEGEKQFKDSMKVLNAEVKAHAAELKTLAIQYDKEDKAVENLTQRQKVLSQSLETGQNKVKTLSAEYDRQKSKLDDLKAALEKARRENGSTSDEAIKAENAYSRQAKAVSDLDAQLSTAKGQIASVTKELKDNAAKLSEAESKAAKLGETFESAGNKMESVGGGLSKAGNFLTVGVTAPLATAGIAAIKFASDAEESENKVDVAFGNSAEKVKKFASTTVDSYGIARGAALDMAALFGDMGTAMGLSEDQAAEMSTKLVGLAGDLASFKNINLDSASTALKGIFTGETESLKNLGIVMTETNLQSWAMENGLLSASKSETELGKQSIALEKAQNAYNEAVKENGESSLEAREAKVKLAEAEEAYNSEASASWSALSQSEKVMLRYKYVMEQTKNAQGDYARTSDGTANSVRTLQESGKELAVAFGEELLPTVTPLIQGATGLIKTFGNLGDSQKQMIIHTAGAAAAAGPALKIVGTATTGVGKLTSKVGGLAKDISKLKAAKSAAEAVGEVGSKAIKSVEGVSGFSKVLFKLASPAGIAVTATAVLFGVGAAFLKARDDAIKADDIAKHFGDIKLSAEEVEDVAKRLTTNEWTMKVGAVVEAKAKLEEAEANLKSTVDTLNTLDWKVDIGLALTEDEQNSYQSAIGDFVKNAQDYVTQQGYTISLAIDATLGSESSAGSGLTDFSDSFFAAAETELDLLGKQLADKVNASFENGTFAQDRVDIQKIMDNMNDIMQEIQDAEYKAKLGNMEIEYAAEGFGIDKDSFDRLNEKISQDTQELLDNSEEARVTALTSVSLRYQKMIDSGVSEEFANQVRADAKAEIEQATQARQGEAINVGFKFAFDTVSQNYQEEIGSVKPVISNYTTNFIDELTAAYETGGSEVTDAFSRMLDFTRDTSELTGTAKDTIKDMLESLKPQKETLEGIQDDCIAAGKAVPESVKQGLSDIAEWEALSGDVSGMYVKLAEQLANDPAKFQALRDNEMFGRSIPEELATAITMYSGYVYDSTTGLWSQVKESSALSAEDVKEYLNETGPTLDTALADSIAKEYELVKVSGKYMIDNAAQGAKEESPYFNKITNEIGTSAYYSLNNGFNIQPLTSPRVDPQNTMDSAVSAAKSARSSSQQYLDENPISLRVYAPSLDRSALDYPGLTIFPHASGGIIDQPELSLMGEDGPEAIIPLSLAHRPEALDLMTQVADIVRYDPFAYSAEAARAVGARNASRQKAAAQNQTVYQFAENSIHTEIHTPATDPESISRLVTKRITQGVQRKANAMRGGRK